jgi:hypothetical protein
MHPSIERAFSPFHTNKPAPSFSSLYTIYAVQPTLSPPRLSHNALPWLLRLIRRSLGRLLCGFLCALRASCNLGFGANAAEYEADAEPLHLREAVAEGGDAEDHSEHLAGDGDGDEEDRGEGGEGVDCEVLV